MKTKFNFLASLMLVLTLIFTVSCKKDNESVVQKETEKEWSTSRQGDVVYVNNGSDNFFMNYLLYQTLFNRGGYPAVHNHYISTPSLHNEQSTLRSIYNKPSYNNSSLSSKSTINNMSTPSRFKPITSSNNYNKSTTSYKSYSTPVRSSYTTKSYSTPSRSSSSFSSSNSYRSSSFSSPSRSSSFSSSRSFSSPSRSFSSRR